jgi:hypothetical protein
MPPFLWPIFFSLLPFYAITASFRGGVPRPRDDA